jgi:hypothetical protein
MASVHERTKMPKTRFQTDKMRGYWQWRPKTRGRK